MRNIRNLKCERREKRWRKEEDGGGGRGGGKEEEKRRRMKGEWEEEEEEKKARGKEGGVVPKEGKLQVPKMTSSTFFTSPSPEGKSFFFAPPPSTSFTVSFFSTYLEKVRGMRRSIIPRTPLK